MVQTLTREWEATELKLKTSLNNQVNKINNEIIKIKNEIKEIESKLDVQDDAFYGFLEEKH